MSARTMYPGMSRSQMPCTLLFLFRYGKPPKVTRFKKGQSGNPKGRPKGSNNLGTLIQQELQKSIVIKEGDQKRKLTKLEAVAVRLTNDALKGNSRAIELLLRRVDKLQIPEPFEITENDKVNLDYKLKTLSERSKNDSNL